MITVLTRSFVLLARVAVVGICLSMPSFGEQPKPNVVVILADDLGIVDMNAYAARFTGEKPSAMYYETPNLDRLVREGTAFTQAYACHLCSPARASLLTGKYAARTGFTTAVGGNVRTFYNQGIEPPPGYVTQDALEWKDKIDIQQALLNGTTRDCAGLWAAVRSRAERNNACRSDARSRCCVHRQVASGGAWLPRMATEGSRLRGNLLFRRRRFALF